MMNKTGYGIYHWEGYNYDGECVCEGAVYTTSAERAYEEVEKEIEDNYDEYVGYGYHSHKIVRFEEA